MPIYKFSPNQASADERRKTFVARHGILEDLIDRIKEFESGARHCILIGPRGIGKTHLLLLLADTIEADENLSTEWVVVRFAEEEYGITSLAEFFLRVIKTITGKEPKDIGRNTDLALAYIADFCRNNNRHVLLLMDNIQLYLNQFTDVDIGRLRDILTSKSLFLIIGAAPSYFRQMQGYDEAFYNFFEPIHLSDLSYEEAEEMLKYRADIDGARKFIENFEQCKPKIATTTQLTGGNPRLILMLYQVMCESGVTEASNAFRYLLDELTPYFQERMNNLPPQMRKVLDTLAIMESPSTPTELAETTGIDVQAVSSQLKRLESNGFVRKIKLKKGKETRYEVTEKLYRMWREMRTETGETRLRFLVRFLNLWFSPKQLLGKTENILTDLSSASENERQRLLIHLDYLKEASPKLMKTEMEKVFSYAQTGNFMVANDQLEALKTLVDIEERLQQNPNDVSAWSAQIMMSLEQGKIEDALESCITALRHNPDDIGIWLLRAYCLAMLKRARESVEALNKVRELKPNDAEALSLYGVILSILGKYEEAIECYNKAINIMPDYYPAYYNWGNALSDLAKMKQDESLFLESIEKYKKAVEYKNDDHSAYYNWGTALYYLAIMKQDESLFLESFEKYKKAVEIKPDKHEAYYNWGTALSDLAKMKQDESLFRESIEKYKKAVEIKPDFAGAWFNHGWLILSKFRRFEEAVTDFDRVIQLEPDNAMAWLNRGLALNNLGRHEEALESIRKGEKLATEQGLAIASQFIATSLTENSLANSLKNLSENNLGLANNELMDALKSCKEMDKYDLELMIFGYIRSGIRTGKLDFVKEAISKITSELGDDYAQLLRLFVKAIDYMQTDDVGILERLQVEEREIVQAIANGQ